MANAVEEHVESDVTRCVSGAWVDKDRGELTMTEAENVAVGLPPVHRTPVIRVVGLGGAGLQAVAHMVQSGLTGITFAVAHTDARQLAQCAVEPKVLFGGGITRGLGAGGDPDVGRAAAEADVEALRELAKGQDLVILVVGLGGGTGSGAAPVLARAARDCGALVVGVAALPFDFEGQRRIHQAQQSLRQLKCAADAVICLPNQKIAGLLDETTTLLDTFRVANDHLAEGVRGLSRLVTQEGLINVNFADLCRVVRGRQAESSFASASAAGEHRSREVVQKLFSSPFLDGGSLLAEAEAVLASLVGGPDLTLREVKHVMEQINRACENSQVVMGAAIDPSCAGRLAMTLIVTRRSTSDPTAAVEENDQAAAEAQLVSEFPIESGRNGLTLKEGNEPVRPASRFVPPPPKLSPEQAQQLLAQQAGAGAARRRQKQARLRQGMLPLEVVSKGRFARSEPTLYRGEDLDTPTYIRRGVPLN